MSYTYLQLVQRLAIECGVPGGGPSTVTGQTGENLRLVNWIAAAYQDIQTMHEDWDFLRASFSFVTVNQQQMYTPAQCGVTNLGVWARWATRLSTTSQNFADEMLMAYLDWDQFRNLYVYGNMRFTYTRPVLWTIDPQRNFGLGPIPDNGGYTLVGDYFNAPLQLTVDGDTPVIPAKYQLILVYRAMTYYASYESAPEVFARGNTEYKKMVARLQADQLSNASFEFGAPLC